MRFLKGIFGHVAKNYKTTLLGVGGLAVVGVSIALNPLNALNPAAIAQIVSSLGLIVAKDPKAQDFKAKPAK
jgi:hypothetical protein